MVLNQKKTKKYIGPGRNIVLTGKVTKLQSKQNSRKKKQPWLVVDTSKGPVYLNRILMRWWAFQADNKIKMEQKVPIISSGYKCGWIFQACIERGGGGVRQAKIPERIYNTATKMAFSYHHYHFPLPIPPAPRSEILIASFGVIFGLRMKEEMETSIVMRKGSWSTSQSKIGGTLDLKTLFKESSPATHPVRRGKNVFAIRKKC